MTSFSGSDLRGAEVTDASVAGARFTRADLSDVRMRSVLTSGLDIDAPWMFEGGTLLVNGVDVVPLVDAELSRRFPGRELRGATDPAGLLAAWDALQATWATLFERVAAMPAGTVDVQVDGEWSFAQTVRHLVMATDTWFGRTVLEQGMAAYHPLGQPNVEYAEDGGDLAVFHQTDPSFDEVLAVRAERVAAVRAYLATVTEDDLAALRTNPWAPEHQEPVLACLHTILGEEWDHLRYAVRDLDSLGTVGPIDG